MWERKHEGFFSWPQSNKVSTDSVGAEGPHCGEMSRTQGVLKLDVGSLCNKLPKEIITRGLYACL